MNSPEARQMTGALASEEVQGGLYAKLIKLTLNGV
jgi:hypothetical protein